MKNADRTATGGSSLELNDESDPESNPDSEGNPGAGGHSDRDIDFLVCGSLLINGNQWVD